jgi:hypothetical protein
MMTRLLAQLISPTKKAWVVVSGKFIHNNSRMLASTSADKLKGLLAPIITEKEPDKS